MCVLLALRLQLLLAFVACISADEWLVSVACLCCLPLWLASLFEILEAGEWTSPAFLKYLDLHRLERDLVIQSHVDESDGDEWELD